MASETLQLYQVDAFASKLFQGNPAAVVPLQHWLPDSLMQSMAEENNLSETVFFVPKGDGFHIRWFTPTSEVKLCGHATLAAAFVLYEFCGWQHPQVQFDSASGPLIVARSGHGFSMDFPAQPGKVCDTPAALQNGLGVQPELCLASEDYLVVLDSEDQLRQIQPDMTQLKKLGLRGVAVTAPGSDCDFVVRFFAPNYGIDEDPVTGSAYTQLAPYWAERLGTPRLQARQLSSRGGDVGCVVGQGRVSISGSAVCFMQGSIVLP